VDVLRGTHASLTPGGIVLDVHPVPPAGMIEAGGRVLGRLDERGFFEIVRATEAGMTAVVRERLFEFEAEVERDVVERFDDGAEFFETADEWVDIRVPERVRQRVAAAVGPVDLIERLTFRRFRAL
jgi:hypothetical protein